jgi:hypothetical protein
VERRENYYGPPPISDASGHMENSELYYKRLKKALEGESTYWLSKPLRTGFSHQHSLSAELGSKALKAMATFKYSDNQGAMKGSYRQTVSGDVNLSYRFGKWTFRNIMSIASMNNEDSPYGSFSDVSRINPYCSPYDEYGSLLRILDKVEVVEESNDSACTTGCRGDIKTLNRASVNDCSGVRAVTFACVSNDTTAARIVMGLRLAVVAVAVCFIVIGIFNGSANDVLTKAIKICTECIGLG